MMKKRWSSLARCSETILGNFAVVGLALAFYQQSQSLSVWLYANGAAIAALLLAWGVPHD